MDAALTLLTWALVLGPALATLAFPLVTARGLRRSGVAALARGTDRVAVSVIVPCRGADDDLAVNIASVLAQEFAGPAEIIFCVESQEDPATPLIEELLAFGESTPARLVIAGSPDGALGKMHNLESGLAVATGDRIVFLDSDVCLPDSGFLARFVAGLQAPATGLITCFPAHRTIASVPGAITAMAIDNDLLALFCLLQLTGGPALANGSCLAVSREALAASGGLAPLRRQLLMDSALAGRIRAAGYRVRIHPEAAPVRAGRMSWRAAHDQAARWHLAMWRVLPRRSYLAFAWLRSGFVAGSALALVTGGESHFVAAACLNLAVRVGTAAWIGGRHLDVKSVGRWWWLVPVVEAWNGWHALSGPRRRVAAWRGRNYLVENGGRASRLAESEARA